MRQAAVYRNGVLAGVLTEVRRGHYGFRYDAAYFANKDKPAISLTLPKTQEEYKSEYLFPVFFNLLSEGANRKLQSVQLKIDSEDNFGLLLATEQYDTIWAITVKPMP